jgi:hypothetical protein
MRKFLLPLSIIGLLAIVGASPTFGFEKKKKGSTPAPRPHETIISNVTPTAITVSDNKGAKTFTITQFTEINVNGRKGTAADLKPGMIVNVALGTDAAKASRITATDKK